MKILQIAIGASYSTIYKNLFLSLKNKQTEFEVYIPQHKNTGDIKENDFPFSFYSSKIIRPYDKFIYYTKIRRMTKDVDSNFKLSEFSLTHAHSLFTDGAIAYQIKRRYGTPYIVAIRDTDVNQYFSKAVHLRKKGLEILKNAENIIFISKAYKEKVINEYIPKKSQEEIEKKSRVIPNGVNKFWLENKYLNQIDQQESNIKIIFVGQIIKRKNILNLAKAINIFEKEYKKEVELTLIGEKKDSNYFNRIINLRDVNYIPYVGKEELLEYYRQADLFVMPSITETFGLVYAEAMSQSLPVIYSKGQGFDGQFKDGEIGYSVDPLNPKEISTKIKEALNNKKEIRLRSYEKVDVFNWDTISTQYLDIYKEHSS